MDPIQGVLISYGLVYSTHRAFQFADQSYKDVQMIGSCLFKVGIFLLVNLIEIQGENLCTGSRSSGLLADLLSEYPTFYP